MKRIIKNLKRFQSGSYALNINKPIENKEEEEQYMKELEQNEKHKL